MVSKNTDTLTRCGNGRKGGDQGLWLNKDREERVELHMGTVIDYILLPYLQTLWILIQLHKY